MPLETRFHAIKSIHLVVDILYLYDTVRVSEEHISVLHLDIAELHGRSVLDEAHPESESSWDDFLDGMGLLLIKEHRVVTRSDEGESIVRGIEFEEDGSDENASFELLFEFIVECYEEFREISDFLREFEE